LILSTLDQYAAAQAARAARVQGGLVGDPVATDPVVQAAGLAKVSLAGTNGDRPGATLDPATLARLACDATLQRVLLSPTGAVLDLGRTVRLASPAQRRALTARDQGCVIPGCGAPPEWCDAHHVTPWAVGGRTDIDAMVLVCQRHHTGIHTGTWTIHLADGIPWVTRPAWADPHQTPLRNTTHEQRHHARQTAQQLRLSLDPPHP
jgi:hypothetical protein